MLKFEELSEADQKFVRFIAPVTGKYATGIYNPEILSELLVLWNKLWDRFESIFEERGSKALLEEKEATQRRLNELEQQQKAVANEMAAVREAFNATDGDKREIIELHNSMLESLQRKRAKFFNRIQMVQASLMLLENVLHAWEVRADTTRPSFLKKAKEAEKTKSQLFSKMSHSFMQEVDLLVNPESSHREQGITSKQDTERLEQSIRETKPEEEQGIEKESVSPKDLESPGIQPQKEEQNQEDGILPYQLERGSDAFWELVFSMKNTMTHKEIYEELTVRQQSHKMKHYASFESFENSFYKRFSLKKKKNQT